MYEVDALSFIISTFFVKYFIANMGRALKAFFRLHTNISALHLLVKEISKGKHI